MEVDAAQTAPIPRAAPATRTLPVVKPAGDVAPGTPFTVYATPQERLLYATARLEHGEVSARDVIHAKLEQVAVFVRVREGVLHGQATVQEATDVAGRPTFRIHGRVTPAALADELEHPTRLHAVTPRTGIEAAAVLRRPRRHGRRAAPPRWPARVLLALTVVLGFAAWATAIGLLPLRVPWWAWLLPLAAWVLEIPLPARFHRRRRPVRRSLTRHR